METLIEIVHVLVALFMILVVLVQGGNQGGVGAAFGGGNSSGVFGATGATSLLGKLTYGAAFIFMLTSITLTIIQGKSGEVGLKEKLKATSSGETNVPGSDTNKASSGAEVSKDAPGASQGSSAPVVPGGDKESAAQPSPAAAPVPAGGDAQVTPPSTQGSQPGDSSTSTPADQGSTVP